MGVNGSKKDYHNGPKNNWRRTEWNVTLRRTNGSEQVKPSLYLSGPQDLDRKIATGKGVPSLNLIGIDKSLHNVRRLKKESHLALDAEIVDVLRAWPSHHSVASVHLDFCSGLENRIWMPLTNVMSRPPFYGSVFTINFQRGRDASSSEMRGALDKEYIDHTTGVTVDITKFLAWPNVRCMTELSRARKNRALMFFFGYFSLFTEQRGWPSIGDLLFLELTSPVFLSYKSGALTFDTVIFRPFTFNDFPLIGLQPPSPDQIEATLEELHPKNNDVARRIIATLAVRTRRMLEYACR